MAEDREGRHQRDDREDEEQRELLELERVEQVAIHVAPVAHPVGMTEPAADRAGDVIGGERVVQLGLDTGDAGHPGEVAGGPQREIGDGGVVLVHADLHGADHGVAAHLRHHADGRQRPLGRDHGDGVARQHAEGTGHLAAQDDAALVVAEDVHPPAVKLCAEVGHHRPVAGVHAAHEAAAGVAE